MKYALLHVSLPFLVCVAVANTSLFNNVMVDLSYEHYAEQVVDSLPGFLAMPFNSIINVGYVVMGLYWLFRNNSSEETKESRYVRQVFALMAIFYAPVQWTRLATMRRAPAVLDQWVTLPIFAWVSVWCSFIEGGASWRPWFALTTQLGSVLSYGLALVHARGFEVALGGHIVYAVHKGVRVHRLYGDHLSQRHLVLALVSCGGFVGLKLLDHWLARYALFQCVTGHFWSKVCDVLQFHFSFCLLTCLSERSQARQKAR
ncbi:transmembrane protein 187 [Gadus morhua]|uniref:transmembrane protein 187 n=1 Tax=Gadus morhua TaxID=8049 RepID=UPI0011B4D904|nr:transmembrane protein 187 [Gadus morhua]